jgi:hypothetical protein
MEGVKEMNMAQMDLIGDLIDADAGCNVNVQVDPWDPDNPLIINTWKLTAEEAQIMVEMSEVVSRTLLDQRAAIDELCRTSKAA